ncbi:TetR/AcrR family transcriptional regulator [Ruminococcaceae bacterium OttesenSCG-928-D13]|nr:TetR/AcrR family transcriptional regulator [Ruminococcaceae bacterium OttesenSCG-928-D13]
MARRDAQKTRECILNTAIQEFAEKGIHGTRVDEIAQRSGYNKGMIYAYFGSKEDLYKEVLHTVFGVFADAEREVLMAEREPVQHIESLICFYFDYAQSNPVYVNLLLWENLNNGVYINETDYGIARKPSFDQMSEIIQSGQVSGAFKSDIDVQQFLLSAIMLPFSYFSNKYTLSKLLGTDLYSEESLVERKKSVTAMLLEVLLNK